VVHARYTRRRQAGEHDGHQRSRRVARKCRSTPSTKLRPANTPGSGSEFESPTPLPRAPPGSCPRGGGRRRRASPCVRAEPTAQPDIGVILAAVPLACHSQRSPPGTSGQPRTTPNGPRPAPFAILAGDRRTRSGFGSRGSPVQIRPSRPPARTPCPAGVPTAPHSANRSTLPLASRSTTP
jgi:hypothetical protein